MSLAMSNDPKGSRNRAGRVFYDQLSSRFWERPSKYIIKFLVKFVLFSNFIFSLDDIFDRNSSATAVTQRRRDVRGAGFFKLI